MNELLFRQAIFHPITKEFLKWHYWGLIDGAFVGINTGWYSPTEAIKNSQRFIGLADKNRVRVYEGDIIKYYYGEVSHNIEVFRDIATSGWQFGIHNTGLSPRNFDVFEVIGNIVENPELLEGK